MFCPQCGQERLSDATSFCSRCGFLLTGTTELLYTGGIIPGAGVRSTTFFSPSARTRGMKQGLFIFLMTFLIVPIVAILTVAIHAPVWGVPIASIALFMGGLLRMAYALMFEPHVPTGEISEGNMNAGPKTIPDRQTAQPGLSAGHPIPASVYAPPQAGTWRDTSDLEPGSVTDGTTKLLEKNEMPPQ